MVFVPKIALNPISHYGITKVNAEKEVLGVGGISLRLAESLVHQ